MNQSKEELDYYRDDITPADGVKALSADTGDDISDDVQELLNQYLGVSKSCKISSLITWTLRISARENVRKMHDRC